MKTIYKYPIKEYGRIAIEMPERAIPIAFQTQAGVPTLWCMVDTDTPMKTRVFAFVGTGHPLPDDLPFHRGTHVGTCQIAPSDTLGPPTHGMDEPATYVFHLFDYGP